MSGNKLGRLILLFLAKLRRLLFLKMNVSICLYNKQVLVLSVHSLTGAYSPGRSFGLPFRDLLITHIQIHGRTPLDDPRPQQPSGRRPTPLTARPLGSAGAIGYAGE
jgi:hypothetical protein